MPNITSLTHYFGESDTAVAFAAKFDALLPDLWFINATARSYAFQLSVPKVVEIGCACEYPIEFDGVHEVDGVKVKVFAYHDPAESLATSRFAGQGVAVKLTNGGVIITPEFWNLPPETKVRPDPEGANAEELAAADAPIIEELKAFTAEMRQREMETVTARRHFEKLQAEEAERIAAAEALAAPEEVQLELALEDDAK